MENDKKLFKELLKADGIDPAGISESERLSFAKMFDQQLKQKQSRPTFRSNIWEIIMKNKITKLTVAAVVIIGFGLGIIFLDKTATPAYSIEQTIEAINKTRIVHMFCRDWEGNGMEIWMKLNPETRLPDYFYLSYPKHNAEILTTPEISYKYFKTCNVVQYSQKKVLDFDLRLENILDDMTNKLINETENDSQILIRKENNPDTGDDVLIISSQGENVTETYIDLKTKLPTEIHIISTTQLGNEIKDFDQIIFDEEPPIGTFEFIIPQNAAVLNIDQIGSLEDSPDYGILVNNLSKQEAAELLATQYWDATIRNNIEELKKLAPAMNLNDAEKATSNYIRSNTKIVELIEIGTLVNQQGCTPGQILPCTIRHEDGTIKKYKLVVELRQIDGQESMIMTGFYGMPQEIK